MTAVSSPFDLTPLPPLEAVLRKRVSRVRDRKPGVSVTYAQITGSRCADIAGTPPSRPGSGAGCSRSWGMCRARKSSPDTPADNRDRRGSALPHAPRRPTATRPSRDPSEPAHTDNKARKHSDGHRPLVRWSKSRCVCLLQIRTRGHGEIKIKGKSGREEENQRSAARGPGHHLECTVRCDIRTYSATRRHARPPRPARRANRRSGPSPYCALPLTLICRAPPEWSTARRSGTDLGREGEGVGAQDRLQLGVQAVAGVDRELATQS